MKQIILGLTICTLLASCSDIKYAVRQTSLRKLADEKVDLGNGYTCDVDNYERFMTEVHKKRKRHFEKTGKNLTLGESLDTLCRELDKSVFSRKDNHISSYELEFVNFKDYETPLWNVK